MDNKKKRKQLDNNNNNNNDNDNSNNNNEITYEIFKNEFKSLNRSDYRKLQALSKRLDLGAGGTKEVIYNRIESYLKAKQDLLEENQFKSNINPFNKKQPRLEITEGNEKNTINNVEIAFWKIFRNKIMFKLIFSNFKFSQLFNYDRIIGTQYIFNNFSNAKAIYKDKIKSKSYFIRNFKEVEFVIKKNTKNTKENAEFFTQLFSTYPYYCQDSIIPHNFDNTEYWLRYIVDCGNIPAYQAYTTLFKLNQRPITSILKNFQTDTPSLDKIYRMQAYLNSIGIKAELVSQYQVIQTLDYSYSFRRLIKLYNTPIQYYIYFKELSKANFINNNRINNKSNNFNDYFIADHFNDVVLFYSNSDSCKDFQKQTIDSEYAKTATISESLADYQRVVISTGDMVLIDYLFSKYNNFECFKEPYIKDTLPYIKKEEVFNYFYEKVELINSDNNSLWINVNEQLIENYESLMKSASKKFIFKLYLESTKGLELKKVERALNNPSLYITEGLIGLTIFSFYFYLGLQSGEQEITISILEKLISYSHETEIKLYFQITDMKYSPRKTFKIFDWMLKDLSDQDIFKAAISNSTLIIKSGINPTYNKKYQIKVLAKNWQFLLWKCGRFDIFFRIFKPVLYTDFFIDDDNVTRYPLRLQDRFLFSKYTENKRFLSRIITQSAKKGIISVFKAIFIKKPLLLKIGAKNNPTDPYFNSEDLKKIVKISIENCNEELTHFLLQHINFSKKDLDSLKDIEKIFLELKNSLGKYGNNIN
ncbi:hypothetical protein DICPUDRAFT_157930 [Dictyostelium purpureum]|uniref:Uncharacterized protein n=1 Tax=Dictyostelium purpureum TaxID=5786 RepID=F1A0D9_DICPU|nr:uncharacterized protein DICPUDRAFT_157930 [Dictyostelium purpureum]EGC30341.1 hypothetical protein DICPUDRAFT_157930 [Dictyostelium purpureum]|eukprot:XP_003293138.1 hypothetical protein DICPUDRAFT_157930 [Dictyostelium purpureum]